MKKKVICVGDSITYGHGVAENRGTDSYPAILQRLLSDEYEVQNFGVCGCTLLKNGDMPYVEEECYRKSLDANGDIYIIMLGTNDSKPYNWNKEDYRKELKQFIERYMLLSTYPNIYVMLPPMAFPIGEENEVLFDVNPQIISGDVHRIVGEIAEELQAKAIDLYKLTNNHPEWFMDGVHPNVNGNKAIATCLYKSIGGNLSCVTNL